MDKGLKEYEFYINYKIEELNKEKEDISGAELNKRIKNLLDYHNDMIRNFQHERLVHLIVTIFFAILLITTIIAMFVPNSSEYNIIDNLSMILVIILFIVESFYVKYYYYIENGTQRLYLYSKQLFELTD